MDTGATLVSTDGRPLSLVEMRLATRAAGGLARTRVEQRFTNPWPEPLEVTYQLPLPGGGAVSGFAFRVGERRVTGEIDTRGAARERYEQALVSGRTAALLEQDRASSFTQIVGNVPPGVEVIAEVIVDQRLEWLREGAWEWRFPTVQAPRYQGAPGRVPDARALHVEVADAPLPARLSLTLELPGAQRPESPSHPLRWDGARAVFAEGPVRLDRELVVRWPAAAPEVGVHLQAALEGERAFGLLTVVPPLAAAAPSPLARDLVVLLDTSGSMSGAPLEQARRVVSALVDTLGDGDRLELLAFASECQRWRKGPERATAGMRRDALRWLAARTAGGGTEMHEAVIAALAPLGAEAQRQVVLVTDGHIGFEDEVIAAVAGRLPAGSRVHTLAIGSSPNRALTGPAARAGRGVEVSVAPGEDPERAARRLVDATRAPLLVDLELSGSALVEHAPAKLPDVLGAAPLVLAVALRAEGGELTVRGRLGAERTAWTRTLRVAPGAARPEIPALFARERVEDLELLRLTGATGIDASIESIGLEFQIATRLTSWVAIADEPAVEPGTPARRVRVPHELPHETSVAGLGLRAPAGAVLLMADLGESEVTMAAGLAPPPMSRARISGLGWFQRAHPTSAPPAKSSVEGGSTGSSPPSPAGIPPQGTISPPSTAGAPPPRAPAPRVTPGERRLRARVVAGPVLVLVARLDAALAWRAPAVAIVVLADGTELAVGVNAVSTTGPGDLDTGAELALVLVRGGLRPVAVRVTVVTPAGRTELVLAVDGSP